MTMKKAVAVFGGVGAAGAATVAITLLLSGGLSSASAKPAAAQAAAPAGVAAAQSVPFARNASGLTYGSELQAASPSQLPDLISAYATNGKLGYVKNPDLHPAGPANPTQALQQQRAAAGITRTIDVYNVDGRTVIGSFVIQPGSSN